MKNDVPFAVCKSYRIHPRHGAPRFFRCPEFPLIRVCYPFVLYFIHYFSRFRPFIFIYFNLYCCHCLLCKKRWFFSRRNIFVSLCLCYTMISNHSHVFCSGMPTCLMKYRVFLTTSQRKNVLIEKIAFPLCAKTPHKLFLFDHELTFWCQY